MFGTHFPYSSVVKKVVKSVMDITVAIQQHLAWVPSLHYFTT